MHGVPAEVVAAQIDAVASDLPVGAVKTGMLATAEVVETVAEGVARWALAPVVVDPVMVTSNGDPLVDDAAVAALVARLLPLAAVATPNAHEAARLVGFDVTSLGDARRAARAILAMGPQAVLVKGGHLDAETDAVDVLVTADGEHVFREARIETPHTHGTGCTYASAVAANLARGMALPDAVRRARSYVQHAIRHAPGLGGGHGPTRHFWFLSGDEPRRRPAAGDEPAGDEAAGDEAAS